MKGIFNLFQTQRLLLITNSKITTVAFGFRAKLILFLLFSMLAISASLNIFLTLFYPNQIREQNKFILVAQTRNLNLSSENSNLRKDLMQLNQYLAEINQKNFIPSLLIQKEDKAKLDEFKPYYYDSFNLIRLDETQQEHDNLGDYTLYSNLALDSIEAEQYSYQPSTLVAKNIDQRIKILEEILKKTGLMGQSTVNQNIEIADLGNISEAEIASGELLVDSFENYSRQGGPFDENLYQKNLHVINVNHLKDIKFENNIEKLSYLEKMINSMPLKLPMKQYRITSKFGKRIDPIRKRIAYHYGLDFAGRTASKIYATGNGIIKFSGRKGNYGYMVEIDHGYGITSRYAHLRRTVVKQGQKINVGDIIGYQGNTGRSVGEHLHYEVRYFNQPINPFNFITAGKYVHEK